MNTTAEKATHCADCGALFPELPTGHCGGTGRAMLPAEGNKEICYSCADKRCIEALKDRSRPFVAYVGKGIITTWTGGKLMTITQSTPCQLSRASWTHDRNGYMSIHAVDVHGGHWAGRGSEGIAIKLRPVKGS